MLRSSLDTNARTTALIQTDSSPGQLAASRPLACHTSAAILLLIWGWVTVSTFHTALIVQDECHFFDPVYELVDHGKWRGPHNEYLGHGIEQLQYGHPAGNGLMQAPWLIVTGNGWEAVRLNAVLLRLAIVACMIGLMYRGHFSAWAALASSLLFIFFSYFDESVVRPDAGAGLCLFGMLWQLRPRQTLRQTCIMAVLWAAAGLFHQLAILVGGVGWLCAVVAAVHQRDGQQFRRLSLGAVAAGALFLALYTLPIVVLHGASSVPDLYSGTMYHMQVISQRATPALILRQLLWGIPQFTLLLLLTPWLAWRSTWTSFTERCMAIAYAGGFFYIAARTNFGMWYFVILAPTAAFLFGRSLMRLEILSPRVGTAIGATVVALLAVVVCRHGLVSTPYTNLTNGREMDRLLAGLVDEHVRPGSAVLTTPQFYHQVKRRCGLTRDLEYFATYGATEDLGRFDYVLCMDERDVDDPLQRLNQSQRDELLRRFDVIYDSREAGEQWRSAKLRTWGQLQPIPAIRLFRSKLAPAGASLSGQQSAPQRQQCIAPLPARPVCDSTRSLCIAISAFFCDFEMFCDNQHQGKATDAPKAS